MAAQPVQAIRHSSLPEAAPPASDTRPGGGLGNPIDPEGRTILGQVQVVDSRGPGTGEWPQARA